MRAELAEAAQEFTSAPARFQAVILKAAAAGENANSITLAIGHAYSPEYVRTLIREARAAGKIPPRKTTRDTSWSAPIRVSSTWLATQEGEQDLAEPTDA